MPRSGSQTVRMEPRAGVAPRTKQRFAPTAIQGLEVLALPVARLDAYVSALVEQNPLLDFDYDRSSLVFEELPEETDEDERGSDDRTSGEQPFLPPRSASFGSKEGFDLARLRDEYSETETLHSHVRMQISEADLNEADRRLLDAIIENIDDDGYFSGSMPAVCAELDCPVSEGERMLSFIQGLTPRGVGARTLVECLTLQLTPDMPYASIIATLLRDNMEDLAENRTTKLMRSYRLTIDDLAAIRQVICGLDPRPGASFSQRSNTVYVIPDITITREGAGFSVRVTGELAETVVINGAYVDMLDHGALDTEAREWLVEKRSEADVALANIDQRKQTLHRFGTYLVEAQYDFFCGGEARMRPLTMQKAADALGVHVSTISRTVQDKHVLTPWGVYPLKHFFSSAVACSAEERRRSLSSLAIKDRIKELVSHEDCRKPLSDEAITTILNSEGVQIKRRTVAKYREALGIGRQSQRRR